MVAAVLATLLLTACGGSGGGSSSSSATSATHTPAAVAAALKAAGLSGFHQITGDQLVQDTPVPGVSTASVPAAFIYANQTTSSNLAVTVIVARDPAVFKAVRTTIGDESKGTGADIDFLQAQNVLVNTVAQHPNAAQQATLDRVATFVQRLNGD